MGAKLVAVPVSITVAVFLAACSTPPTPHPATMTVTVATPAPASSSPSAPSSSPTVAAAPVAVGQTAIDGTFAFTVKGSDTDDVVDFGEPDAVYPQGIFVFVNMQIENIGRSPQAFAADYQRLLDSEGREYSPDMRATTRKYAGHISTSISIPVIPLPLGWSSTYRTERSRISTSCGSTLPCTRTG